MMIALAALVIGIMITTDDLALKDDFHYTTPSYEEMGRRFADAYWTLTHPNR